MLFFLAKCGYNKITFEQTQDTTEKSNKIEKLSATTIHLARMQKQTFD